MEGSPLLPVPKRMFLEQIQASETTSRIHDNWHQHLQPITQARGATICY
nr:hypothetical protein [Ktedonobacteraceae bacterium]